MSLSTTTAAPAAPTAASPMKALTSFADWFSGITDWIRSMSPDGSSTYDTGWVSCTANAGFEIQNRCQVRRIGKAVFMRGGFKDVGLAPNTNFQIGYMPAGFAGTTFLYVACATSMTFEPGRGEVRTDGTIWLRTGASVSPYYMYDGVTWLTD